MKGGLGKKLGAALNWKRLVDLKKDNFVRNSFLVIILTCNFCGCRGNWTHDLQIRRKEGVHKGWDREETATRHLIGSHCASRACRGHYFVESNNLQGSICRQARSRRPNQYGAFAQAFPHETVEWSEANWILRMNLFTKPDWIFNKLLFSKKKKTISKDLKCVHPPK